jgi:hypothetical protein
MISRSIYNLKIDTICMCYIPFDRSILQFSNGIRHVTPSTERKLELTAKASMAKPVSQPAVCTNGLIIVTQYMIFTIKTSVHYHCTSNLYLAARPTLPNSTTVTMKPWYFAHSFWHHFQSQSCNKIIFLLVYRVLQVSLKNVVHKCRKAAMLFKVPNLERDQHTCHNISKY